MRQQSSSRGSASVTALPVRSQQSTIGEVNTSNIEKNQQTGTSTSMTKPENSQTSVSGYGTAKWDPNIKTLNPRENWLLMQAISFTGRREITVAEAKIIWQYYDPTTRQPTASKGENNG